MEQRHENVFEFPFVFFVGDELKSRRHRGHDRGHEAPHEKRRDDHEHAVMTPTRIGKRGESFCEDEMVTLGMVRLIDWLMGREDMRLVDWLMGREDVVIRK